MYLILDVTYSDRFSETTVTARNLTTSALVSAAIPGIMPSAGVKPGSTAADLAPSTLTGYRPVLNLDGTPQDNGASEIESLIALVETARRHAAPFGATYYALSRAHRELTEAAMHAEAGF